MVGAFVPRALDQRDSLPSLTTLAIPAPNWQTIKQPERQKGHHQKLVSAQERQPKRAKNNCEEPQYGNEDTELFNSRQREGVRRMGAYSR